MIRAGRGGAYIDDFKTNSRISIGWGEAGDIPQKIKSLHPQYSKYDNLFNKISEVKVKLL